jgi:hypothetical protein
MKQMAGDKQFYQLYFQKLGKAEPELEDDVRKTILMLLYSASGNAPPEKRWRFLFDKSETFLDTGTVPETLPAWLTEADLDFYAEQFKRTGFRGGLNWYRNIDRIWELTPFLSGAKIRQPSLFIAGEFDGVITIYRKDLDRLEETMPALRKERPAVGRGSLDPAGAPDGGERSPHPVLKRSVATRAGSRTRRFRRRNDSGKFPSIFARQVRFPRAEKSKRTQRNDLNLTLGIVGHGNRHHARYK